ncbi:MAG: hypothetical protein FWG67_01490 [Defluviitaleaceae bacterium]|nr:hypothetical protein [Defluviitaleaceae bacterium]
MNKYEAINVMVLIKKDTVDLRIPRLVSRWQLRKVLTEALEQLGITLPISFRIEIKSKNFGTAGILMYDEFALGDGDQIVIVEEL